MVQDAQAKLIANQELEKLAEIHKKEMGNKSLFSRYSICYCGWDRC